MRVRLKGVNRVTKRLANGQVVTYWYAWKGGPRLPGKPGSPEFIAAFNAAVATRATTPGGSLQSVINAYQESTDFTDRAPRTRADYVRQIKKIEAEFGDLPIAALADKRMVDEFLSWRDRMANASRRQADYAFIVLALILAWAFKRHRVPANPCKETGRLYRSTRVENVWTADDEAAFMAKAPARLRLAFMLALWTGQRQGDLLRLPWSAYDGQRIRLRQGKTGARVSIPVGAPLKTLLDATPKRSPLILTTEEGSAWTEDGFRSSWRKACGKAGVSGVTFHDLRGTAVTRLALAECTEAEIATITGHSLRDVGAILDAHYLRRDSGLGVSAIRKREAHEAGTKTPN